MKLLILLLLLIPLTMIAAGVVGYAQWLIKTGRL